MHLVLGIVATGWLLHTMHATPMAQPGLTKTLFALVFGVAVWGWVLGLTGAALRFLSNYSAVRRYIADASYWIYLAHLPVVAALAVWVGHWPLHWGVKYPFILVVSFAVLFLSYHFLVRPTFIGKLLNGRKYPRRQPPQEPATPSAPTTPVAPIGGGPVAQLRSITKKFGTTTALASVDIELRPGELLALLGPNGAGKTTAINLWLGLIEADAGEVTLLGGSPLDVERRRGLGVMMQDVEMYKELRGARADRALFELLHESARGRRDAAPRGHHARWPTGPTASYPADRSARRNSRWQSAADRACCSSTNPRVGLDIQAREALWANVRLLLAEGCSIVLTTHYLEEAEALATRVAVLAKGRVIASGSVDEMRALVARRQISCEIHAQPSKRSATGRASSRHRANAAASASSPPMRKPWCGGCWPKTPRCAGSKYARPDSPKHSPNSPRRLHERPRPEQLSTPMPAC